MGLPSVRREHSSITIDRATEASPSNSSEAESELVRTHFTSAYVPSLETRHPPTYCLPSADIAPSVLRPSRRRSFCEWTGEAIYFDVVVRDETLCDVAWSYPDPNPAFRSLCDHVAFYAWLFDGCFVDDERVTPQPGNFYGGWISSDVAGPFKGAPGTGIWRRSGSRRGGVGTISSTPGYACCDATEFRRHTAKFRAAAKVTHAR